MKNIAQIERLRSPYYREFTTAWQNLLYRQTVPYIEAIKDGASIGQLESIQSNIKPIQELFLKTWILTGRQFAGLTATEHRKSVSFLHQSKGIDDDFYDKQMWDFAINQAGTRIVSIDVTNNKAILNVIRQSLLEGEIDGLGAAELAKFVQLNLAEKMQVISRWSAERIARTEIVGASNRGQLVGAQSLGYNMTKTWLPFIDSRTRTFEKGPFNHAITETVGIYDTYTQTGEALQHPGDPKASAGNVINCRCSQMFKVL